LELLRDVGLAVDVAENGRVVLDKFANQSYDLVLMDVQMPEMDGLAATRALRQQSKLVDLPILAMTANVQSSAAIECLQAGMDEFLGKPIKFQSLVDAVLRLLPNARVAT
jgi:CheY-like chemotaxis protein